VEPKQLSAKRRAELERELQGILADKSNPVACRYRLGSCLQELQEAKKFGEADIRRWRANLGGDRTLFYRAIKYRESFAPADIAELEKLGIKKFDEICTLDETFRLPFALKALKEGWSLRRVKDEKVRKFGATPPRGGKKRGRRKSRGLDGDLRELTRLTEVWIADTTDVWSRKPQTKLDGSNERLIDRVNKLFALLDKVQQLADMVRHKLQA